MVGVVAGLLTSAFVSIAKDKLGSAIAGQTTLLCNFSVYLEDMMDLLETISAVLEDAEKRSVKEKLVRLWLKRLKDVALDISDLLEDYQDTRDHANAKMPGVLAFLPVAYKMIFVANRMKSLREKLSKVVEEIATFNFRKGSSSNNDDQTYDERETMSYLPEEPVIGRNREKQEIINMLSANCINNDETVVVAIYGLGGMGKSTLAQLVYNDTQFKKYDYRIWVYVSQDFSLNRIGCSIISQLPTQEGQQNMGTQQVMKQHLDKLLHGKTVLVVLDDLWEEKMTELEKLKMILRVKGSKVNVIVTTRKEDIAKKVSTNERSYKLQSLEDDKCWQIIKRYSKFELKSKQETMEQVGLDIAKKCGGVALAAQAVGFMLQSIDNLSGWIEIKNSDIWDGSLEDSDVLPSLKLSYERMPPQLRICFSYCAIFPKGCNIIEDDLIQQWIALNFIKQSKGKECINKLLGMSFLQVSKLPLTSQKHMVRYTMHDLVHDLARFTIADELVVFDGAPRRNARAHKYCYYSLLKTYDQAMKLECILPSRAVRFSGSNELDIRSGAFSFAKCLRTLDFSECSGILLPASIGRLKQLRCLIAPRIQNEILPECITELPKLQYLNINGSSKITQLPESIGKLGSLKFLCLSGCSGISKLPESIGDLKCMVYLDVSGCSGLTDLDSFNYLRHKISGRSIAKAVPQSLSGLTQLHYLNFSGCEHIRELPESLMNLQSLSHLNLSGCSSLSRGSLTFLRGLTTLKHLHISGLWCRQPEHLLDEITVIATLTNLEHLDLSHNRLSYLPESIGNLKRLHTLDLSYCYLKSLPKSIATLGLKSLVLDGCLDDLLDQASSLVHYSQTLPVFKVCVDDANGYSNLGLLEGINVSELRIFSLENVRFLLEATKVKLLDKHNLSELRLAWSTESADQILEDKDLLEQLVPPKGLKRLRLDGYRSTSFPGWFMCISGHLPNIVSVVLYNLPTCSNLPPLGQLPLLENLELWKLPNIKKIDKEFCGGKGAFRRLSGFNVCDMEGLEEWNTTYTFEDGVEEFMFPLLDCLNILDCPRLRLKPCPPTFRRCITHGSDQVIFSLEEVDKTSDHCSSSPAIKLDLGIQGDSCQSIRLFHHFPELRELAISAPHLTSLPESMRHLTSLESLALHCCYSISGLPEWLGDLSSLKSLVIKACRSIRSLPSCVEQLTKLQKLEITDSRQLKRWCELEENKLKLAHINVQVFKD